jgi:hypothetical protein
VKTGVKKQNLFVAVILLLSLVVTGCGKPTRELGSFDAYVTKFEEYSKEHNHPVYFDDLIVKFGSLDDSQLGVCTVGQGTPTITISETQWKALTEDQKEILMLHELGHCSGDLKRQHNNSKGENRQWASVMLQWPQKITDYKKNKDQYLAELFHSDSN